MNEECNSGKKTISVDIEVLLKVGIDINPNDDLKIVVYSTDEEEVS